jgi:hypothetical protein
MDFTQHMKECENAAYGQFLIHAIAAPLGLQDEPERIDRAVYKGTSCGAWVRFDEKGIAVGTIVEGSDAEFSKRIDLSGIDTDEAGEAELNRRFWAALQMCEDFADEVWADMDAESDGE